MDSDELEEDEKEEEADEGDEAKIGTPVLVTDPL